ncbi:MAG: acetyl-CoA carboxylase biotin carboxyl carrier protein [Alphaproteobacteria bacterium]|nr:acetyl-CoA carboxylase biotin carboxyl carrier protein [Alphaproteobacteria bacterium]
MPPDADAPEEVRDLLNVDTALIEKLAELLQRTGLTEIELSEGEARIRVAKQPAPVVANATLHTAAPPAAPPAQAAVEVAPARDADTDANANHPGAVRAPMVGTAYLTPEPGGDPFVSVGGEVKEGQTLLIVEAMKVMNPIRSPRSGRVASVMVGNGDPVEYDELLLIID